MRRILSIARLTVANAVRMKIAIIIIFFLLILIPSLPFVLNTDETQLGHVQITLTYSLGMVFFLLAIMTVFIGAASISNEIAGGQMQLLGTKPVSRWQVILGKWLGVMFVNVGLIFILGAITFGLVRFIGRASAGSEKDKFELRNSVFTARVSVKPEPPEGVEREANEEYKQRLKENRIPPEWINPDGSVKEKEYLEQLKTTALKQRYNVAYGAYLQWKFSGIKVNRENDTDFLFLRYKVNSAETRQDRMFAGRWVAGDRESTKEPFHREIEQTTDSPHELAIPVNHVKSDGTMDVEFLNLTISEDGQRGISVSFNPDDGIEILYSRSGFFTNYIRYFLLVLSMLGFMGMLSVTTSSFLSFPVAVLLTFSIVLNSFGMSAFKEFAYSSNPLEEKTIAVEVGKGVSKVVYQIVSHIIPDLSRYSVLSKLNTGRYIQSSLVLMSVLVLIIIFGGIIYTLGCIIFNHKELG